MKANWPRVAVSGICDTIIDCINKTAPSSNDPTSFKMIRTTNVRDGYVKLDKVRYVTEEIYEKWTRRGRPQRGDVLLTREAPLGEIGLLRSTDNVFLGQRLVMYRANRKLLDNRYLMYSLMGDELQGQIRSLGSGSTVEHMRVPDCEKLEIPLPTLAIQRKIAAILSTYDDLIENNIRRIAILEEMAQAIYREWFVNFRFPGFENGKLVNSPLGQIPEGWECSQVSEVFETLGGGTPSKKVEEYWTGGQIPWFAPSDLTKSGNMYSATSGTRITDVGLKKSSAKMFPAYSVMLTSRATIGVLSINTVPACTNQGFITCVPNDRVSALEIFFWLREQTQKILNVATGATFKEITKGNFRKFQFLLPPTNVSEQFNKIVGPIGKDIEILIQKQQNLRTTRDLLLPKLISGKLDVEDLDIDSGIAAEELLEATV